MKRLVIIPAYNEAAVIQKVLRDVVNLKLQANILVVDDGSVDKTAIMAKKMGVMVISHPINRGLGGAIGTGLEYAKREGFDQAITFDADGQHNPADLVTGFEWLNKKGVEMVIGSRMNRKNKIPTDRKILNHLANVFTFLLYGTLTTDSQSGFRGFNRRAIEQINIKTEKMEVSSEIFGEISRLKLKWLEFPIKVRYTRYSRIKGQQNLNALPVIMRLIIRLFR